MVKEGGKGRGGVERGDRLHEPPGDRRHNFPGNFEIAVTNASKISKLCRNLTLSFVFRIVQTGKSKCV